MQQNDHSCQDPLESGLVDFLNADPRPAFVVDSRALSNQGILHVHFTNRALDSCQDIMEAIKESTAENNPFSTWIAALHGQKATYTHDRSVWIGYTFQERWRIISRLLPVEKGTQSTTVKAASKNTSTSPSLVLHQADQLHDIISLSPTNSTSSQGSTKSSVKGVSDDAVQDLKALHKLVGMVEVGFFSYHLSGKLIYANVRLFVPPLRCDPAWLTPISRMLFITSAAIPEIQLFIPSMCS